MNPSIRISKYGKIYTSSDVKSNDGAHDTKLDSRGVALKPLPRRLTQAKPETLSSPKHLPTSPPRLVCYRVRNFSGHHVFSSNPQWRVKRRFVKSSLFSSLMQYQTSPPSPAPLAIRSRGRPVCKRTTEATRLGRPATSSSASRGQRIANMKQTPISQETPRPSQPLPV
jgi:hypothetical protein